MLPNVERVESMNLEFEEPSKKEIWGYGLGAYGIFSIWTLIGSFLTFYYTDVVGIAATIAGFLMLFARVFDGFIDIVMEVVVDKTNTKYGKARPWLLWMAFPFMAATISLFMVPEIGMTGKIIYVYITFLLFNIFYTAVSIPYKSLMGMLTLHQHSRSLANIYSSILNLSGTLLVIGLTQPLSKLIGWGAVATIYGVLSFVAIYFAFRSSKERVGTSYGNDVDIPIAQGVKALFKNKYWLIISLYCVIF